MKAVRSHHERTYESGLIPASPRDSLAEAMDEAMDDAMQRAVTGPTDDALELVPGTLVMNRRHAMIEDDWLFRKHDSL